MTHEQSCCTCARTVLLSENLPAVLGGSKALAAADFPVGAHGCIELRTEGLQTAACPAHWNAALEATWPCLPERRSKSKVRTSSTCKDLLACIRVALCPRPAVPAEPWIHSTAEVYNPPPAARVGVMYLNKYNQSGRILSLLLVT